MARAEPTIVASSPIARWRNPPIFALAYISPARSSKRRMRIIVASHSRATSGSGRSCSAIWAGGYPRAAATPRARPGRGQRWGSAQVLGPLDGGPSGQEVLRLQRVEVLPQGAREAPRVARQEVPEQDDLAVGDVDDLDVVARGEHAVGGLRPHAAASARAARGRSASPWNTRSPVHTAGTSRTPRSAASAVASARVSPMDRRPAALRTAAGCISQAAEAISTVSGSSSERPPAKAWRDAARADATVRPICL